MNPTSNATAAIAAAAAQPRAAIPRHVAIIMDGNGRWARSQGLPRLAGHRAGTQKVRQVVETFWQRGVEYLTLYTFSTENWRRPSEEIEGLMALLQEVIRQETQELHRQNVRLRHLGKLDRLPSELQDSIHAAVELTRNNTGLTLSVAFDYGGRRELVEAVRQIMADGLKPEEVTEEVLGSYLYTRDLPDPDLVIRTGGEMRLSNFLLWQAAYAEFYSTPTYWPDFNAEEVERALEAYRQRRRRFGAIEPTG